MAGFNLDEVLKELEKTGSANLNEEEENVEVDENVEDTEKIAAAVEQGQIMARAFVQELEKLAVGVGPMTPNTGAVDTPDRINHMSNAEERMMDTAQIAALIAKYTNGERAQGPNGYVGTPQGPIAPTQQGAIVEDVKPLPADVNKAQNLQMAMAQEKQAADTVLSNLYAKFFGGE